MSPGESFCVSRVVILALVSHCMFSHSILLYLILISIRDQSCPFVGFRTGSCVLQLFRCEKFSTLPPQNPQHHHQHHHRWTPFTDFLLACTRTQLNFNECSPVNGQPKVSECSACCTTLYVYTHSTYIPTRIAIDIYMNLIKFFAPNAYCMWPDGLYN